LRWAVLFMGTGGQGIVLASEVVAEVAFRLNLNVATLQGYGAEVRGGPVYSYVVADEDSIENPFVESFDLAIILHQRPLKIWGHMMRMSKNIIFDSDLVKIDRGYPLNLTQLAIKHDLRGSENMIAVGVALALISLRRELAVEILSHRRGAERNIKALELGYSLGGRLKMSDLRRGVSS